MNRDVGEMGETTLLNWAAQAGITANSVKRDRTGWDFFVELPSDANWSVRGGALDTAPETVKCLVQVKSTDTLKKSVSLTLANWRHLITASYPSFILVLHFDDCDAVQRGYLIEMNESRAAVILKRIRALSHEQSPEQRLRKTFLSVRYGPEQLLERLNGAGLKAAFAAAVGADVVSYVRRKHHWLATVGYEQGRTQMNVRFRLPEAAGNAADALADLTLGMTPELEVIDCELVDVRFGIPAPQRLDFFAGGYIRVAERRPVAKALLRFRDSGGAEVDLAGDVYVPFGLGPTPDESALKVRVESRFVDLVFAPMNPTDLKVTIRLVGGDEDCVLDELRAASQAILLWMRPGSEGAPVAELDLIIDGILFFTSMTLGVGDGDADAVGRSEAVLAAWNVASSMGIPAACRVHPAELFRQSRELKLFADILSPQFSEQDVKLGLEVGYCEPGDRIGVPMAFAVKIGEHTAIVAGALFGDAVELPRAPEQFKTHKLVNQQFLVLHKYLFRAGENHNLSRDDLLAEVAEAFQGEGKIGRWWEQDA